LKRPGKFHRPALQVSGNNSQLRLYDTARGHYWHIYTEAHPNPAISGNLPFFPGPSGDAEIADLSQTVNELKQVVKAMSAKRRGE
jgi:hypothetical protein